MILSLIENIRASRLTNVPPERMLLHGICTLTLDLAVKLLRGRGWKIIGVCTYSSDSESSFRAFGAFSPNSLAGLGGGLTRSGLTKYSMGTHRALCAPLIHAPFPSTHSTVPSIVSLLWSVTDTVSPGFGILPVDMDDESRGFAEWLN